MNLAIVTGASKGLGKEISNELKDKGYTVLDISRSSERYSCDLSLPSRVGDTVRRIKYDYQNIEINKIVLINNAGVINPISPVGKLVSTDIISNVNINLISPMIICNEFINVFKDFEQSFKIINISSGVSKRPKESWSIYSAAKAGLDNFSVCLSKEQKNKVEIYSIDPGLIDTDMQKEIRSKSDSEFPEVDRFIDFKKQGMLVSASEVAKKILKEAGV